MTFIISSITFLIGFLLTVKSDWFMFNFGRVSWVEKHLKVEGGSRLFYKLLGILIIIGSFMAMTGLLQKLILKILSPYFRI